MDFRSVGEDLNPTGPPNRTYDIVPHAQVLDFDDSGWECIAATDLDGRRGTGKVCFNWYRIDVTIPELVGNFDPTGSTVAFEVIVDDYAEVWVNGEMPRVVGQAGGTVVSGLIPPTASSSLETSGPASASKSPCLESTLPYLLPPRTTFGCVQQPSGSMPPIVPGQLGKQPFRSSAGIRHWMP